MTGAIADMNECTLDGRSSIDPADVYNHERWRKCTASEIPPTSTTTSAGANAQRLPTADVYNPTAYRGVWVCSLPVAFGRHGDPYTRPRHLSAGPAWRSEECHLSAGPAWRSVARHLAAASVRLPRGFMPTSFFASMPASRCWEQVMAGSSQASMSQTSARRWTVR